MLEKTPHCSGIFYSKSMEQVYHLAEKLAQKEEPILILGETGVGKDLLAQFIYQHSPRRDKPLVTINCSALYDEFFYAELFGSKKKNEEKIGLLAQSQGGTIYLNEISDLSPMIQAALLRVLERKEIIPHDSREPEQVSFQLLSSSNKDLFEEAEKGHFRKDLLYRLGENTVYVPPLRDRKEEIPMLVEEFCGQTGKPLSISPEVMRMLCNYDWPGNIRQLRGAVTHAAECCNTDMIKPEHLPAWLTAFV